MDKKNTLVLKSVDTNTNTTLNEKTINTATQKLVDGFKLKIKGQTLTLKSKKYFAYIFISLLTTVLPLFYYTRGISMQNTHISTTTAIICMLIFTYIYTISLFNISADYRQLVFFALLSLLIIYNIGLFFIQFTQHNKIKRRYQVQNDKFVEYIRINGGISLIIFVLLFISFFITNTKIFLGASTLILCGIITLFIIFSKIVRIITRQTTDG